MKKTVKVFSVIAVIVVLFTACDENFIFPERPLAEESIIIPVEHITGIPIGSRPGLVLTLSGTVTPKNATNKRIEWSITGNGAGATLVKNKLTAENSGTVTLTALIKNGLGEGEDYTQNFNIIISTEMIPVRNIEGIPSTVVVGGYELNAVFTPSNALYKTILYSVKDAGTTGATITNDSTLTTTSSGTVVLTAFIANGKLNGDYTQDFEIDVVPFVAVTEITEVLDEWNLRYYPQIGLNGIVSPFNATNKTIVWTVKDAGIVGATISSNIYGTYSLTNNYFYFDDENNLGTVTITATIVNGVSVGEDYTQDFEIVVGY